MDAENKPVENVPEAASPAANDKSAAQWRLILLVLGAVGVGLVIGILALQVTEYRFYKAPPNVWPAPRSLGDGGPQPGAGGTVSAPAALAAPATLAAPLSPVTPTMPSAPPVPVITITAPSDTVVSVAPPAVITTTTPSEAVVSVVPPAVMTTTAPSEAVVSVAPSAVITTTEPSETVVLTGVLSAPVVAATSAPAPTAATP